MPARRSALEDAERAGFDLSLIEESLRLSYDQRAMQHQEALNLALELERAGRKLRERPQPDVLTSIKGVGDFPRVYAQSAEIELFRRRCRVISLDDLIRAKEALGREKDLLAVKELRGILEKTK